MTSHQKIDLRLECFRDIVKCVTEENKGNTKMSKYVTSFYEAVNNVTIMSQKCNKNQTIDKNYWDYEIK